MAKAPFVIRDDLTNISLTYKNRAYIADEVLPRVTVDKQEFRYTEHTREEQFRVPDMKVGRTGRTKEIEFTSTQKADFCEDYGLQDPIPQADIDNADSTFNPEGRATELLTDLVALGREKRVAGLVFAPANYAASNKTTLSGTSQWNDFVNSTPISDIMDAMESMIMTPNTLVFGRQVYNKLRQHPDIIKATQGNSGDKGAAARQALAELFEVDKILVGASLTDNTVKGQTPAMSRVWGKHMAMLHINHQADANRMVTFGITAQWKGRVSGTIDDPNIGLRGGKWVRVGESLREKILAQDCGYIFEDAIA